MYATETADVIWLTIFENDTVFKSTNASEHTSAYHIGLFLTIPLKKIIC